MMKFQDAGQRPGFPLAGRGQNVRAGSQQRHAAAGRRPRQRPGPRPELRPAAARRAVHRQRVDRAHGGQGCRGNPSRHAADRHPRRRPRSRRGRRTGQVARGRILPAGSRRRNSNSSRRSRASSWPARKRNSRSKLDESERATRQVPHRQSGRLPGGQTEHRRRETPRTQRQGHGGEGQPAGAGSRHRAHQRRGAQARPASLLQLASIAELPAGRRPAPPDQRERRASSPRSRSVTSTSTSSTSKRKATSKNSRRRSTRRWSRPPPSSTALPIRPRDRSQAARTPSTSRNRRRSTSTGSPSRTTRSCARRKTDRDLYESVLTRMKETQRRAGAPRQRPARGPGAHRAVPSVQTLASENPRRRRAGRRVSGRGARLRARIAQPHAANRRSGRGRAGSAAARRPCPSCKNAAAHAGIGAGRRRTTRRSARRSAPCARRWPAARRVRKRARSFSPARCRAREKASARLNFAATLARQGCHTLLIAADLRRAADFPGVART